MRITLTIILSLLFLLSSGQSYFSKTAIKEEGRFISGRIDADKYSINSFDKTGLVNEIHLNIELWTLMGEPLEKYLFRWIKGNSVTASDYTTLNESILSKYPDLLKRYNSLRPSNIELRYQVSTELRPEYIDTENLDVCGEKFINNLKITKEATWGSNSGASGHRDINWKAHFYIDKAGAIGNELIPSSPKDWLNFIDWGESGVTNQKALNTFKYASKMTLYGVEVTKMELPMREIDAIAKEFKKRETGEEPSDNENDPNNEKEANKTNMWKDLDEANNSGSESDFDNPTNKSNKDDNDPWSSVGKSASSNNSWTDSETSNSSDDPWSNVSSSEADNSNFEIKQKDGKYGVVNAKTGKTIFPFIEYRILDYKPMEGMAKVIKYISNREIDVSCDYDGSVYIELYKEGYMDSSGDWLIDPMKTASITGRYEYWNGLLILKNDGRDKDVDAIKRKIRAKDKKCGGRVQDKVDELKQEYKSNGYKISEQFYRY